MNDNGNQKRVESNLVCNHATVNRWCDFLINGIRILTEMNEKIPTKLSIYKHGAYGTNGRRNSQISGDIFAALKQ